MSVKTFCSIIAGATLIIAIVSGYFVAIAIAAILFSSNSLIGIFNTVKHRIAATVTFWVISVVLYSCLILIVQVPVLIRKSSVPYSADNDIFPLVEQEAQIINILSEEGTGVYIKFQRDHEKVGTLLDAIPDDGTAIIDVRDTTDLELILLSAVRIPQLMRTAIMFWL